MDLEGTYRPGATRFPHHILQGWNDKDGWIFLQAHVQWRLNAALNTDCEEWPSGPIVNGWHYLRLGDAFDSLAVRIPCGLYDATTPEELDNIADGAEQGQLVRVRPPFVVDGYCDVALPPRPWHFAWHAANEAWVDFAQPIIVEITAALKSRPIPALSLIHI